MSKSETNSATNGKLIKEIFVNVTENESRIAICEEGKLVELLVERPEKERLVGDIYKGKVTAILPGIQAAFVDLGLEKAGFLHFSDMSDHRGESNILSDLDVFDEDGEEMPTRSKYGRRTPIASVLKKEQELLVQVIKEPISTKGPRITSEISLPGRYIVLIPGARHIGVSKKISSWAEKKRLRKIALEFLPDNFGMIIRTVAEGRSRKEFAADIKLLTKLWKKMKKKVDSTEAPNLVHKDIEITTGIIRDLFTPEVTKVVIDNKKEYRKFLSYLREVAPQLRDRVELYSGETPIFDAQEIEPEIEKMFSRKAWLKKGGYIVIDQTEALVTIDVNTGRFTGKSKPVNAIFETNLLAAREIARQARLRDIGGIIIVDFIDMENKEHRRKVFEEFKKALKRDRSQTYISSISDLGLIEMTRQRIRPSFMQTLSDPCPVCNGIGRVLSKESIAMKIERWFKRASAVRGKGHYQLVASSQVIDLLTESFSNRITKLEDSLKITIDLIRDTALHPEEFHVIDVENETNITDKYKI
ncbi:MAG: Rne/Rng family ribonuclease [candidate division Zixibacteria bacterium]|nr:Rne/Rng family ribonuclease [candidate division Zixibacteria bacterium]